MGGLAAFCVPQKAAAWGLGLDDDPKISAHVGYGQGIPTAYGGGIVYGKMAYLGYNVTDGGSSVVSLNVTARDQNWPVSPLLGFSFNWVDIKTGDIEARGYERAERGTRITMMTGIGIRVFQGFYIDGGINFFKNEGFTPFGRLTWPLN